MRIFKAIVIIEDNEAGKEPIEKIKKAQLDFLNDSEFDINYKFETFEEIQPQS